MGVSTRAWTYEACIVEVHVRARRRGEDVNDSCLFQHEVEQRRLDDKTCHTYEAHRNGGAMLGLKLSGDDGETRLKPVAVVRVLETGVLTSRERNTHISAARFTVSSKLTFFFDCFGDVADRDLTAYLIHSQTRRFPVDEQQTPTSRRQGKSDWFIAVLRWPHFTAREHLKGPEHLRFVRRNQSVPRQELVMNPTINHAHWD